MMMKPPPHPCAQDLAPPILRAPHLSHEDEIDEENASDCIHSLIDLFSLYSPSHAFSVRSLTINLFRLKYKQVCFPSFLALMLSSFLDFITNDTHTHTHTQSKCK
ncbi:hypothetical protein KP509_24G017000 [Ceratopteris richardii]|uniref:Uncharacterized protein n=1 Tax=Ceratopteris richardii TaxID=49495 RepID=A0A8T2RV77_CERRI|nr:hypothetical protein KP509_24G017000 [Ceratopteris richardii]